MRILKPAIAVVTAALLAACGGTKSVVGGKSDITINRPVLQDTVPGNEQPKLPAKDFRAVWIATIGGIDWPRERFDEEAQKQWYRQMLDTLQRLNINTVFFQVRPKADAFYDSPYEPWSEYITGYRGKAPTYDVLRWLIDETHAKGMAFHAWMNPYRIGQKKTAKGRFDKLDPKIPKQLVKDYRLVRIYNPALPETRRRVCAIVADMLRRYDVDGIHFDDYFYPDLQKGEKMNDGAEYRKYGKEYSSIEEFRRAMVDSLIVGVHDTIKAVRPDAVFSISPQGNYHNNYHTMYADIAQWSARGWCDVIIPQLYWSTEKWFRPRLKWFSENAAQKSHLMIGYGLYRFDKNAKSPFYRTADDLKLQMDEAYADRNVAGAVLYSAIWLMKDPVDINGAIAKKFCTPALPPYLGQEPEAKPQNPEMLAAEGSALSWQPVDGCYYAVYEANGKDTARLVAVTKDNRYNTNKTGSYFVTAVRKGNNAESVPSKTVTINYENNIAGSSFSATDSGNPRKLTN